MVRLAFSSLSFLFPVIVRGTSGVIRRFAAAGDQPQVPEERWKGLSGIVSRTSQLWEFGGRGVSTAGRARWLTRHSGGVNLTGRCTGRG